VGAAPGSSRTLSASASRTSKRPTASGWWAATVAGSSPASTGSISTATTSQPISSRPRVSDPRPGPTSTPRSPASTPAWRTILRTVPPSCTKFCPRVFVGRTPRRSARARISAGPSSGEFGLTRASLRGGSVPVLAEEVTPRAARGGVAAGDVGQAPLDLRLRVGAPVVAELGHLAAREGLRDAVGARGLVVGVDPPAALLLPQCDEALELVVAPASLRGELLGDGLRGARLHRGHVG